MVHDGAQLSSGMRVRAQRVTAMRRRSLGSPVTGGASEPYSKARLSRPWPEQDHPLLLKAEEAAQLLNLSRSKVFERMARGELPGVVRIGRSVRISREELVRWVREQSGEATADAHKVV